MKGKVEIRRIIPADNQELASIIRSSLEEFKANKPGTVYFDETTDRLYSVFEETGSSYFVATIDGKISGGAGIYPTPNLPDETCELVKMYLSPAARGKGIGKMLMTKCIDEAKDKGYKHIYIETMPELIRAIPMYEKFGFRFITASLGNSGHTGCDLFMIKDI